MLRHPIDLKRVGESEVEINLCRAEILEEKWRNEDALWIVPRFWREAPRAEDFNRECVAIMGDNIVVKQGEQLDWIPIHNINGPSLWGLPYVEDQTCFMSDKDLRTSTRYLISITENSS